MTPSRDERAIRAQLAVRSGVDREFAAELFGFSSIYDLHATECDLSWKAAARTVAGAVGARAEERS